MAITLSRSADFMELGTNPLDDSGQERIFGQHFMEQLDKVVKAVAATKGHGAYVTGASAGGEGLSLPGCSGHVLIGCAAVCPQQSQGRNT